MADICTDNRFEVIEEYKRKLIESTNIDTSPDEMKVIDNILFRFWQMGWLETITRMQFVKESANTLIHSVGETDSAKAFRNAGRFIWNAIDGEPRDFEKIPAATDTNVPTNDRISRREAIYAQEAYMADHPLDGYEDELALIDILRNLPSAQPDDDRLERCRFEYVNACKILAHRTPDTRKKDVDDAYAVVRTLYPIFGEEASW